MNGKQNIAYSNVIQNYSKVSDQYDLQIKFCNLLWQAFGFRYEFWRKKAVESLALAPDNSVLDIGCGTGLNFNPINKIIGSKGKIVGIDISEKMLSIAQRKIEKNQMLNTTIVKAAMESFESPLQFDAIISTYAIEFSTNPEKVIQNAYLSLKPGGRLVLLGFKNQILSFRAKLFLLFLLKCIKDYPQKNLIPDGKIILDTIIRYFSKSYRTEYFGGMICLDAAIK